MTEIRVQVADAATGQGDVIMCTVGLGSCVAIDPRERIFRRL